MKKILRTTLLCALAALATLIAPSQAGASASPATPHPYGHFTRALQYRDGSVLASGVAFDRSHPAQSIRVCVAVHATCVRTVRTTDRSVDFNRTHSVSGRHAFTVHLPRQHPGVVLNLRSYVGKPKHLSRIRIETAGHRVVDIAKRYVGKARYTYGGASPRRGFDCSGYVLYTYQRARIAHLPHNTDGQRHARHMRRIPRSQARPGDLIFYMSGGSSYHVAIYAGHGWQYAAADERDGIRYQRIWSSAVEFRTDWH
jgi:cell wall-associated NlpC family hydrolase